MRLNRVDVILVLLSICATMFFVLNEQYVFATVQTVTTGLYLLTRMGDYKH